MSYNDAYYNMDYTTRATLKDIRIDEEERQEKMRAELIAKFANGWERYNKEPLFRQILEAAARGRDSWEIIDKLIDMNQQLSERCKKLLTYGSFPQNFTL